MRRILFPAVTMSLLAGCQPSAPPPPSSADAAFQKKLQEQLIDAKPGHRMVYYRGHLAHDRMPSARVMDNRSRAAVHTVANRVMTSADKGLVLPVQRRLGPGAVEAAWKYVILSSVGLSLALFATCG